LFAVRKESSTPKGIRCGIAEIAFSKTIKQFFEAERWKMAAMKVLMLLEKEYNRCEVGWQSSIS
jgi:hypothetical protein